MTRNGRFARLTGGDSINIVRAKEIVESPVNIEWLVENRLLTGGLSILGGAPKGGKSTLARYLAHSVAIGQPWLGSMQVQKGPVLYISLEDGEDLVKQQLSCMGSRDAEIGFVFAKSHPDLAKGIRVVANQMKRPPVLIVVDTLQRLLLVNDLNNYAEVTKGMEPVMDLSRETGAHVLMVHHARKTNQWEDVGNTLLGSVALLGSVDTALVIRRYPEYRTLESLQRSGPDLTEQALVMNPGTMHLSLKGTKNQYQEKVWEKKILRAIAADEGFVYQKDLHGVCDIMGKDESVRVGRVVRDMVKAGRLYRGGVGGRKDPFKYGVKPFAPPVVEDPAQHSLDI